MSYLVKELRQEQLIALLVAGLNLRECAEQLRVTPWTVRKYVQEEDFKLALKERSGDAYSRLELEIMDTKIASVQRLEEGAAIALEEMINLVQGGKSEQTRFRAAQDLMDRDPKISRTKRIEETGNNGPKFFNSIFLQQVANIMKEESVIVNASKLEQSA